MINLKLLKVTDILTYQNKCFYICRWFHRHKFHWASNIYVRKYYVTNTGKHNQSLMGMCSRIPDLRIKTVNWKNSVNGEKIHQLIRFLLLKFHANLLINTKEDVEILVYVSLIHKKQYTIFKRQQYCCQVCTHILVAYLNFFYTFFSHLNLNI